MKKKKSILSDKTIGIIVGIVIALSAIGVINAIAVSSAHSSSGMHDMMPDDDMSMMHSMMMNGDDMTNGNGMTGHMSMMHSATTEEEISKMLEEMDKDGDGFCDHCGMSVESCREMMSG